MPLGLQATTLGLQATFITITLKGCHTSLQAINLTASLKGTTGYYSIESRAYRLEYSLI